MRLRTIEATSNIQNMQVHFANQHLPCLTKLSLQLSNVFCNLNTNTYCILCQNHFTGQELCVTLMSDHEGKLPVIILYLLPAFSPPLPQQIFSLSSFSLKLAACLHCSFCGILFLLYNVYECLDLLKRVSFSKEPKKKYNFSCSFVGLVTSSLRLL